MRIAYRSEVEKKTRIERLEILRRVTVFKTKRFQCRRKYSAAIASSTVSSKSFLLLLFIHYFCHALSPYVSSLHSADEGSRVFPFGVALQSSNFYQFD